MENNAFSYNYPAARNKEVESIRRKYMPREESNQNLNCFFANNGLSLLSKIT